MNTSSSVLEQSSFPKIYNFKNESDKYFFKNNMKHKNGKRPEQNIVPLMWSHGEKGVSWLIFDLQPCDQAV